MDRTYRCLQLPLSPLQPLPLARQQGIMAAVLNLWGCNTHPHTPARTLVESLCRPLSILTFPHFLGFAIFTSGGTRIALLSCTAVGLAEALKSSEPCLLAWWKRGTSPFTERELLVEMDCNVSLLLAVTVVRS